MDIIDLLESGALKVPWPTRIGNHVVGSDMAPPSICSECPTNECAHWKGSVLGQTCSQGMTFYSASVQDVPVTVYGLTGRSSREDLVKRLGRNRKGDLKGRAIGQSEIHGWFESLRRIDKLLQDAMNRELGDKLEALHETPKLAQKIRIAAEQIIFSKRGNSLDEKFLSATAHEKSIYKASEILVDTFELLTVFINPESARLGNTAVIEPFKLIHKLSIALNTPADGGEQPRRVNIEGTCHKRYQLLDSFKIVPMTILNNAFKYSLGQQPVEICFEDREACTRISIANYGPLIVPDDLPRIFERRFRGDIARQIDSDGMGIGLFVAQQAALANGTSVSVVSTDVGTSLNGYTLARNTFSFEARDVPSRRIRT